MLVLIAHGSRDADWRASLENLATAAQAGSSLEEVRLAFMQFSGPTVSEVIEEGIAREVTSFRLLPLFMAKAGHVDKDIKPLVDELGQRFPQASIELLGPVGEHALFPELILNIANDTLR